MQPIFNASAWGLILQADAMTKFVLLALLVTSVICVAIILFKMLFFLKERATLQKLVHKSRNVQTFNDFLALQAEFKDSLAGTFLGNSVQDLRDILQKGSASDAELGEGGMRLGRAESERFEMLLSQSVDSALNASESFMPVLGTSAAVAPLVGLFGTVWGLIHAFMSISQERTADIAVVAPGIAEALLTTLAGLIVAVPAMIFFHYFSNELRKMEHQLNAVSDRFFSVAMLSFAEPVAVSTEKGKGRWGSRASSAS